MVERKVPASIEAEQSLLASILYEPERASELINGIEESDFYFTENKYVFNAIQILVEASKDVDVASITSVLDERNLLTIVGGTPYLLSLTTLLPSSENIKTYIDIVKTKALQRETIETCQAIIEKAYEASEDISDLFDYTENQIYAVTNKRTSNEFESIADVLDRVKDGVEKRASSGGKIFGIPSGFQEYDGYTNGFQKGELIILAARPSVGKSALAVNFAYKVAEKGYNVAFFTLEMSSEQVATRIIGAASRIRLGKLKDGNLSTIEWKTFDTVIQRLKNINIFFDDRSGVKISEVYAKCRQLKKQNRLDFVVIDYLQLLSGSNAKSENRVNEVSEISRKLKNMARDLEVPVLALSQLSRGLESRDDKRPRMSDLRESGSIEQDADIITFLYRADYYQKPGEDGAPAVKEEQVEVEMNIAKNRSGSLGTLRLNFELPTSSFTSVLQKKEY